MIKISVITVLYNAKTTIEKCIQSVLSQTYENIEYIVIDGASTDSSVDIIRAYSEHIAYFISERDSGIYDAYNKALDVMSGDWCVFLNADDAFFDATVVADIVERIQNTKNDIVYGKIQYDNGKIFNSCFNAKIIWKNTLHHQGAFYKATIFNNRRYDTTNRVLSDYKLNLELYRENTVTSEVDRIISLCGSDGITKKYKAAFYIEESKMKASVFGRKIRYLPVVFFPYLKYIARRLRVFS